MLPSPLQCVVKFVSCVVVLLQGIDCCCLILFGVSLGLLAVLLCCCRRGIAVAFSYSVCC